MSANRRRHINALPGLKLLMGIAVGGIFLLTGLGYVYCQNKLHRLLGEIGKLETENQKLRMMQEVAVVSIEKLSAPQELRKKLANGFFTLSEISDDRVVHIPLSTKALVADANKGVRPVSTEKGGK